MLLRHSPISLLWGRDIQQNMGLSVLTVEIRYCNLMLEIRLLLHHSPISPLRGRDIQQNMDLSVLTVEVIELIKGQL